MLTRTLRFRRLCAFTVSSILCSALGLACSPASEREQCVGQFDSMLQTDFWAKNQDFAAIFSIVKEGEPRLGGRLLLSTKEAKAKIELYEQEPLLLQELYDSSICTDTVGEQRIVLLSMLAFFAVYTPAKATSARLDSAYSSLEFSFAPCYTIDSRIDKNEELSLAMVYNGEPLLIQEIRWQRVKRVPVPGSFRMMYKGNTWTVSFESQQFLQAQAHDYKKE